MTTDTQVQELIINKLTKAQYDAAVQAGTINENELYMVTDTTYPTTEELVAGYQPLINESNKLSASLVSGLANIATTGEYSDLVNAPVLATVATTGDYNDLTNKPSVVQSDWAETDSAAPAFILNKPTLANIATTGEWADLVNVPAFKNIATTAEYSDLVNAPVLATVATSGDYNDLTNKPTVDQTYNASSTNAQSGTAVANAIANMQTITNMVDVVSNTSTNTTYPTASAVYNAVNTKSSVVFRDWSAS